MKAISVIGVYEHDNVEIADDIAKGIEPKATYMEKYDFATVLFMPAKEKDYNNYIIGKCLYDTLWTNKYEELKNRYAKAKTCYEQISLF